MSGPSDWLDALCGVWDHAHHSRGGAHHGFPHLCVIINTNFVVSRTKERNSITRLQDWLTQLNVFINMPMQFPLPDFSDFRIRSKDKSRKQPEMPKIFQVKLQFERGKIWQPWKAVTSFHEGEYNISIGCPTQDTDETEVEETKICSPRWMMLYSVFFIGRFFHEFWPLGTYLFLLIYMLNDSVTGATNPLILCMIFIRPPDRVNLPEENWESAASVWYSGEHYGVIGWHREPFHQIIRGVPSSDDVRSLICWRSGSRVCFRSFVLAQPTTRSPSGAPFNPCFIISFLLHNLSFLNPAAWL